MAINDFGKKIGGAKKDLWKLRGLQIEDLMEMNDAERLKLITKDNVWPKVDYAALVADGLPRRTAWFIKTVRDSLPKQPTFDYDETTPEAIDRKQQTYIGFISDVRDAVMGCKTDEDILRIANAQWLEDNGFITNRSRWSVTPTPLAGGAITSKFLKAFCLSPYDLRKMDREMLKKQFLFSEEEKTLAKYEFYRYKDVEWGSDYDGRTQMKVPFGYGASFYYPTGEFADKDSWVDGSFFVTDKGRRFIGRNFESLEAARAFVLEREAGKETVAEPPKKKKGKTRFAPKQLAHISRTVSDDYRHGKDMGGNDYMEVFGFKGGEFGNWMSEKDRQGALNLGYEALLDLAKALQIEPSDISLGKELSIAFGARGSGSALAHYEPLRQVINLTKMRGAGSLAHEWAHALDDIFGKQLGLAGFMSENISRRDKDKIPESFIRLIDAMQYKYVSCEEAAAGRQADIERYTGQLKRHIDGFFPIRKMTEEQVAKKDALVQRYLDDAAHLDKAASLEFVMTGRGNASIDAISGFRKEVTGRGMSKDERINLGHYQASLNSKIQLLSEPARVKTDFYRDSQEFDKQHAKTDNGYWASKVEMFARAFACYVTDKLDGKSDYLSGHSELAVSVSFDGDAPRTIAAIPQGEERKAINLCFDALFEELKELGLLHHRSDFTNEVNRFQPKPLVPEGVKSIWEDESLELQAPEGRPGESHQLSFVDLIDNAFERAGGASAQAAKGNKEIEFS